MKTTNSKPSAPARAWLRPATRLFSLSAVFALMTVAAQAQITYTPFCTNVWVVTAGYHYDLTNRVDSAGTTVRGVALSPLTTNVLFSSTYFNTNGGSGHVATLDFASGSNYLAQLNGTGIGGGIVGLMNVRVSDDGSVYACNRRDGGANTFTIYRWPSETDTVTAPVKVVDAAFTQRMGDHMDVRGSGTNTEIVVVGTIASGATVGTNFYIFRPTDDTLTAFTNFSILVPGNTGTAANNSLHGVTFEGTNNAIYVQDNSSPTKIRRISYDPVTLTATCTRTNATDSGSCRGLKYYASTNGVQLLAAVQYNTGAGLAQIARVFQIPASPTAALSPVLSSNFPAPYTGSQNGNGLGQVDAKNGYFVFGAPGYGLTLFKVGYTTTSPPLGLSVTASGSTFISGYPAFSPTFTASVSGSAPLSYQWYYTNSLGATNIAGANTNIYAITNLQAANAGGYFVIVTNQYGKATSSVVSITVLPNGSSLLATQIWSLAPGSTGFLNTSDQQRGMGYDPIYQRLVVVSRFPTNGVHLVDAATGADQGEMDVAIIQTGPPGTFVINMCGVADDGAVYAGNLITSGNADTYVIYRWDGATNTATMGISYFGNPLPGSGTAGRIGDTMVVRGAGVNTEILCSFRNGTNVAIFNTLDGVTFNFNLIAITNLPDGAAGLGVAWGAGNTFWTKSGFNLRHVSYDIPSGIGGVTASYAVPTTETVVGVDNANGYAATIGTAEIPQNLALYDISTPAGPSINTLVDRELFPANNVNGNLVGSVLMNIAGGRIFALDCNNGIIALAYAGKLSIAQGIGEQVVTWPTTASVLQSSTNVAGPYLDVSGATSPYTNNTDPVKFFRLKH